MSRHVTRVLCDESIRCHLEGVLPDVVHIHRGSVSYLWQFMLLTGGRPSPKYLMQSCAQLLSLPTATPTGHTVQTPQTRCRAALSRQRALV